ncbi:hypothetical protein ACFLXQ_05025 [Chloroflexota bacterium]
MSLTEIEKKNLFYDNVHLTEEGHAVWGEIIGDDLAELVKTESENEKNKP